MQFRNWGPDPCARTVDARDHSCQPKIGQKFEARAGRGTLWAHCIRVKTQGGSQRQKPREKRQFPRKFDASIPNSPPHRQTVGLPIIRVVPVLRVGSILTLPGNSSCQILHATYHTHRYNHHDCYDLNSNRPSWIHIIMIVWIVLGASGICCINYRTFDETTVQLYRLWRL